MTINWDNWSAYNAMFWHPLSREQLVNVFKEISGTNSCIGFTRGEENVMEYDSRIHYDEVHLIHPINGFRGIRVRFIFDKTKIILSDENTFIKQLAEKLNIPVVTCLSEDKYQYGYWQITEPNGECWAAMEESYFEDTDTWVEGLDTNKKHWIKLEEF